MSDEFDDNKNGGRDDSFHGGPDDLGGWKPGPIGKGNPPRRTSYEEGHHRSRGKRNRKKQKDIAALYREEGSVRVKLPSGKSIVALQGIIRKQHHDALKGNAAAAAAVISANIKLNPPADPEGEATQLSVERRAKLTPLAG